MAEDFRKGLRLHQVSGIAERVRLMSGRIGTGYVYWCRARQFMADANLGEPDVEAILRTGQLVGSHNFLSVARHEIAGHDTDGRPFRVLIALDDEGSRIEIIRISYSEEDGEGGDEDMR